MLLVRVLLIVIMAIQVMLVVRVILVILVILVMLVRLEILVVLVELVMLKNTGIAHDTGATPLAHFRWGPLLHRPEQIMPPQRQASAAHAEAVHVRAHTTRVTNQPPYPNFTPSGPSMTTATP